MYITDNTSNTGSQLGPWEVFFAVEDELARSAWFWPARQPTVRSDWTRSRPRAGLPSPGTNRRATTRCRAAPLRRVAWILFSRRRTLRKSYWIKSDIWIPTGIPVGLAECCRRSSGRHKPLRRRGNDDSKPFAWLQTQTR